MSAMPQALAPAPQALAPVLPISRASVYFDGNALHACDLRAARLVAEFFRQTG